MSSTIIAALSNEHGNRNVLAATASHLSLCCADVPLQWLVSCLDDDDDGGDHCADPRDQCRGYFRGHWHPQGHAFRGAPIVLSLLVNAPEEMRLQLDYKVRVFTAGAPPPAAILVKMAEMDFDVMQVYG